MFAWPPGVSERPHGWEWKILMTIVPDKQYCVGLFLAWWPKIFFSTFFDYSFDYFLTIKLRPGRSYLVSFDYLTEQNVSESIFKMKNGADANGCNVIV